MNTITMTNVKMISESEKAFQISIADMFNTWVPKSLSAFNEDGSFSVADWFYNKSIATLSNNIFNAAQKIHDRMFHNDEIGR